MKWWCWCWHGIIVFHDGTLSNHTTWRWIFTVSNNEHQFHPTTCLSVSELSRTLLPPLRTLSSDGWISNPPAAVSFYRPPSRCTSGQTSRWKSETSTYDIGDCIKGFFFLLYRWWGIVPNTIPKWSGTSVCFHFIITCEDGFALS